MAQSALAPHFILAGKPHCIPDSKRSATLTVFFEVWDSQAGSCAKALAGHTLHFGSSTCKIVTANKSPSVPLCQRCWKWGHPQQACKARHLRCPRCSEPHLLDDHQSMAGCCKAAPGANPPRLATLEGQECPQVA